MRKVNYITNAFNPIKAMIPMVGFQAQQWPIIVRVMVKLLVLKKRIFILIILVKEKLK